MSYVRSGRQSVFRVSASLNGSKKVEKVVLAYSGGLDTSVILKWLQETYDCEVVTFTADLGQVKDAHSRVHLSNQCLGLDGCLLTLVSPLGALPSRFMFSLVSSSARSSPCLPTCAIDGCACCAACQSLSCLCCAFAPHRVALTHSTSMSLSIKPISKNQTNQSPFPSTGEVSLALEG